MDFEYIAVICGHICSQLTLREINLLMAKEGLSKNYHNTHCLILFAFLYILKQYFRVQMCTRFTLKHDFR